MGKTKRILDSVHGYIYVKSTWMKSFIDNPYFQRLRRIEQTSARSIYPSARHDRFIHSLGVFHLGCKIVESIKSTPSDFDYVADKHDCLFTSYLIACLMHDCGHTPFSHTFENYFKHTNNELPDLLIQELEDEESFKKDVKDKDGRYRKVAPHEYLSAILCLKKFRDEIINEGAKLDLVARMITGIQYQDGGHSFENCLISLIHGDVIDADRLDYVCRDRWASGYSTSIVDIERLVTSIHLVKTPKGEYEVCYSPSAIHDIEGVLKVKEFQQLYVINHHTVCYEQHILQKAMEHTAYCLLNKGKDTNDDEAASDALKKLCQPQIMWDGYHQDGIDIDYIMDDDFIILMKRYLTNMYVKQWFSRSYDKHLLWKNKSEFFSMFPNHKDEILDKDNYVYRNCEPCKLVKNFKNLNEDDFLRVQAVEKKCHISPDLNILLSDNSVRRFGDLHSSTEDYEEQVLFFYLYLSDKALALKDEIINFLNN